MSEPQEFDVLEEISAFLDRYLHCSAHQRTVLALWVLHNYCFYAADVTPYLSIQSAHKQSGKTLCLRLLSVLCEDPALTAGFTLSNLARRMKLDPPTALLLDECQATLGARARRKAPSLRALLAGSFHCGVGLSGTLGESDFFCPKAFAGTGQLPEELADRSIPIILQPLGTPLDPDFALNEQHGIGPSPSGHNLERFQLTRAQQEAEPLKKRLAAWTDRHLPDLEKLAPYSEAQFPPQLSPRRREICEPLIQLADAVGGDWPVRSRQALLAAFEQETAFDLQAGAQLLSDVHRCFFHHGFPERISTAVLLDWIHTQPSRPWDAEGPLSAGQLARLLAAFEIRPRLQRIDAANPARGYQMDDFKQAWRRHGLAIPWDTPPTYPLPPEIAIAIAAKNAPCNTVADAAAPPSPTLEEPGPQAANSSPQHKKEDQEEDQKKDQKEDPKETDASRSTADEHQELVNRKLEITSRNGLSDSTAEVAGHKPKPIPDHLGTGNGFKPHPVL